MNDPYDHTTVTNALSLADLYPGVYFLGPTASRVSFASQQRRALNLIWALNEARKLSGLTVGVVGGGLAGMTAAAAAIACGADVWLFDAGQRLCWTQRETDIRYVHPTINFWPQEPLTSITRWPFLNWFAAPASEVIHTVERQWEHEFARTAQVKLGVRVHGLDCHSGRVEILYGNGGARQRCHVAIIAVGFGAEQGLPGIEGHTYWSNNSILRDQITIQRRLWLSGVGDGGLIDGLRLCYADFDRGRLLVRGAMALSTLRDRIQEIEIRATACEDDDERSQALEADYLELVESPRVLGALEGALATSDVLPMGYIVHRQATPFDHRAAPIHRLLFALALKKKLIEPRRGSVTTDDQGPMLVQGDGNTHRIHASQIFLRHGASGALAGLISDEAIAELRSDIFRRHQDALLTPRWPPLYFERQPAAQFRNRLFKPREFALYAREFLQKALHADGIVPNNVGIAKPANDYELVVKLSEADADKMQRVPDDALGLAVRTSVEDAIVLFEEEEEEEEIAPDDAQFVPGALVSFGTLSATSNWHPVTCLVTEKKSGESVGLCVLHEVTTQEGEPVYVRQWRKDRLAGRVRRTTYLNAFLSKGTGNDVACVLFDLRGSAFQAAPNGERLNGVLQSPLDLLDESEHRRVRKWGPGGDFTEGSVVMVGAIANVHTRDGMKAFSDLTCVQGKERFSQPGDSGSLVVTAQGEAVGVVFAGSESLTYLLPIFRILDLLDVHLLTTSDAQPADLAPMMELAWLRLDQGRLNAAGVLFRRVLVQLRAHPDANPMEISSALQGQAAVLSRQGNPEDAIPLLREALDHRIAHFGDVNPQVASTLQALGHAYADQGQFAEAVQALQRACEIRQSAQGEDSVDTAAALHGLGSVLRRSGNLDEADALLSRARAIRLTKLGPQHRDSAETLLELGWLAFARRDDEQADECFQQALSILASLPATEGARASALQGLGAAAARLGKPQRAEEYLRTALDLRIEKLGEQHPRTAVTLSALGHAYADQAKYAEAEACFRRALAIQEARGANHPDTAATLRALGMVFRRQRRLDEALPLLERSLRIRVEAFGVGSEESMQSLTELGWLAIDQGRLREAESLFERGIQTAKELHAQPAMASAQQGLASALMQQGRTDRAKDLLRSALALREAAFGMHHSLVASTLQALGYACGELGDFQEAEELFRRAVDIRLTTNGPDHPETGSALKGLGWVLRRQQRFDEAAQILERIVDAGASTER
ncbi:tetratricopeptide repeat protein [Variovorax sp. J22P271]|uniref:tetratricopeptide repeat protein n=1 Tax=Variovorax davisae TaxID=3053515 RepID=UPI002574DB4A|nr:tetratricopeptide repeat protein [Variovorax sp. J22P271]MDM0037046.1 tetratricopeptide repeat protein [Variovorax sp. J22P271]